MVAIPRSRIARHALRTAAAAAVVLAGAVGGTLAAQGSALAMLDRLQPGQWELRERDSDGGVRRLCITNGRGLIQIRHPGEACQSFVVEDGAGAVTVQYTCRTSGYGRTRIRLENAGLAQVETQGVVKGLPFDFTAEARRVGNCP